MRTGSVEMVRVACTHPVNPLGVVQGGGVLCSQVVQTGLRFGGAEWGLIYVDLRPGKAYVVW
jgi:hypothetical protein